MNFRNGFQRIACVLSLALGVQIAAADPPPGQNPPPPWSMGAPIISYNNNSPRGYQLPAATPCAYNPALEQAYGWPQGFEPTRLTNAIADQAVAGGFNLVWIDDVSQLPIAAAHGLRAQLILSGPCITQNAIFATNTEMSVPGGCSGNNWQAACWPLTETNSPYTNGPLTDYLNGLIDSFKASPAAYSYFLEDEPCDRTVATSGCASRLSLLGAIAAYIRQRDPAHLVYINLLPPAAALADVNTPDDHTAAVHYPNYDAFLDDYVSKVHPALLSYDSYNLKFSETGTPLDDILFVTGTQTMANASARYGIPFMAIVQGESTGDDSRVPTASQLAFLANTTLAFGARGISYFNYWRGFTANPPAWACSGGPSCGGIAPFPNGAPTAVFSALQSLNPIYRKIAARLQGLTWMGTYIKGYSTPPTGLAPLPASPMFDIPALQNIQTYSANARLAGALIGYFGIARQTKFAYVVNLNYLADRSYRVTGPGPMSKFDPATGTWIKSGQNYADIVLSPGGGALVGLTSAANTTSWLPAAIDAALH